MARHAEHLALALPIRPPHVRIQRWLYEELRAAILNGRLSGEQRLPPTRDLAHQFGIAELLNSSRPKATSPQPWAEEPMSRHRCRTICSPR